MSRTNRKIRKALRRCRAPKAPKSKEVKQIMIIEQLNGTEVNTESLKKFCELRLDKWHMRNMWEDRGVHQKTRMEDQFKKYEESIEKVWRCQLLAKQILEQIEFEKAIEENNKLRK